MAKITKQTYLGKDEVYDISMPDIHNFIANDIVVHNCDLESRTPLVGNDGNSGYLFEKYDKKAAQVSTRTLLRIKSAILDANRFVNNGEVEEEVQKFSKSLPNTPQGVNDHDYVFGYEKDDGSHVPGLIEKNEELQKYATDRPEEWDIVKRALSLARQHSRHACFTGDTLVKTLIDGKETHKPITECDGQLVYTGQGNVAYAKLLYQGVREVREYTMDDGSVFQCTSDHRVLTPKGWFSLQEVEEKDLDIIDFNKKKIKINRTPENIERIADNKQYSLIKIENKGRITVQCPNNHRYETTIGNFYNKNQKCQKCPKKYTKQYIIKLLKEQRPDIEFNEADIDAVHGWKSKITVIDLTHGPFVSSPKSLIKYSVQHPNVSNKNKGTKALQSKLKKYGKNWTNAEQAKQTLKHRYGTENAFNVNNGRQKTMLKKYGTTFPLQNTSIKEKFLSTLKNNGMMVMINDNMSLRDYFQQVSDNISYNKLFVEYKKGCSLEEIVDNNINHVTDIEHMVINRLHLSKFNKMVNNKVRYKPDFKLNKDTYMNVDGLYWHSDLIKQDKKYHFLLRKCFEQNGLNILQFREDEINMKFPIVKSIIQHKMGLTGNKIFARKTTIKTPSTQEARQFLDNNHLMGYTNARHTGLYYNNTLVSILSYKEYKNYIKCERFCSAIGSVVIGGFSKLINGLKQGKPIHYWVDLRYGTGYHLLNKGFQISHETLGWKWTNLRQTYNRRACMANMDDRKLSEREYANELGLVKIYDAGQRLYVNENKK